MNPIQTVGIIGAMEAETEDLKSSLGYPEVHRFGKGFTIWTGSLNGKNTVLCQRFICKLNAAIAATLLITRFRPDCIINTGSAGGIGTGLKIGDVVIGTETAHHDVDVCAFGYVRGQVPQLPARYRSDAALCEAAEQAASAFQAAAVRRGLIVSGDSFVHSSSALAGLHRHFPDAEAVEMEAAAIAQTCVQFAVPFVVVRAVSDSASDEAKVSFETFLQTAARHSAQMVRQIAASL